MKKMVVIGVLIASPVIAAASWAVTEYGSDRYSDGWRTGYANGENRVLNAMAEIACDYNGRKEMTKESVAEFNQCFPVELDRVKLKIRLHNNY